MRSCDGPVLDPVCGVWECRRDFTREPEEGESWEECCERCQAAYELALDSYAGRGGVLAVGRPQLGE